MKKNLLFVLGMLIALPGFTRDIEYPYEGQTLTYTVIDEDAKTVQTKAGWNDIYPGNKVSGNLVIPSQIKDGDEIYYVTEIADISFINCRNLTSVTIPESVTSIGTRAFDDCRSLTSITIPESVTSIGTRAFDDCSGLNYAEFASIEALCKIEFGDYMANPLYSAHKLYIDGKEVTSVTIPESVEEIKASTFAGCSDLTSITMPEYVITSIGEYAFYNCSSLTSITIPVFVTKIGKEAFRGCSNLTSITIPEYVTEIGDYTFEYCSSLTSITIPESVTSIGRGAFFECSSLTSITIPESVTSIGNLAFYWCSSLTSITIPESVTSIGNSAFYLCSSLTAAIILSPEVKIGEDVFGRHNGTFKCAYPNTMDNPFESDVHAIAFDPKSPIVDNYTIYGPGRKSVLFVPYNKDGDYAVPSSVTEIGAGAFSYLPNLKTVEIPNDVTSIGNNAFANCKTLETVILPMKLETLGSAAFANSSSIKNVVFNGPTPVESSSDVFDSQVYEDATLYVRSGRQTLFMAVSPWKFFYNITDEVYSGVENVIADFNEDAPCEVFNLNGVKVAESTVNLPAGLYIVRQGNAVKKIAVK